jgi:hypothetical protein
VSCVRSFDARRWLILLCLLQNRCGVLRVDRVHSALLSGKHNKAALRDPLQIRTTRRACSAGTIALAARCVVRPQHFGVAGSSQLSTLCCSIVCGRARGVGPWSVCCSCYSPSLTDCNCLLSDRSLIARRALECVSCAMCEWKSVRLPATVALQLSAQLL